MRRLIAITLLLIAVPLVLVFGIAANDGGGSGYEVRAIFDIMREPTRERLGLIINEFGTALAGRGKDLNAAIHRANPALRDTDKVLAILAAQNRTLADLAKNSDAVLTPLAARRRQVADFVV